MYFIHFLTHIFNAVFNCGVKEIKRIKKIMVIQNQALRKINFKKLHEPTEQLHMILISKVLWHCSSAKLPLHESNRAKWKLVKSFSGSKYCGYNHSYQTRSVARKLLNIPYVKTDAYGTRYAKYHCITEWNNFTKTFSNLSPANYRNTKIKEILKKHFLNKYWSSLEKHHKTNMLRKISVSASQPLLFLRTNTYDYSITIIIISSI